MRFAGCHAWGRDLRFNVVMIGETPPEPAPDPAPLPPSDAPAKPTADQEKKPEEFGGRGGLDPTRYGDWEKNGRCIDF